MVNIPDWSKILKVEQHKESDGDEDVDEYWLWCPKCGINGARATNNGELEV